MKRMICLSMPEFMQTFLLGALIAVVFVYFKLPVPVTPTFAGFMGIAGLFVGYIIGVRLLT
jgi:XapX domain-containing protein